MTALSMLKVTSNLPHFKDPIHSTLIFAVHDSY